LVRLPGREIGSMQCLCLHGTAQQRKTWLHIHASSEIWTRDPSACSVEYHACMSPCGRWDDV